ncbi:alcohol dehydrogenase [Thermus thermophilus]|jgi:NADPH:quinone reductase-like Zn-dependent oxidoreductase|uniref:Alcohol dehydrogenase n=2 Tax=Thermus thermophilus TaxID=274 RepID=Q5SL27_THET8|nr:MULTISPECIES: zinc-binding dehydrogenase [Thermus]2EIH_A Chain A, Alcohol dehydrogenase [Thermus thermophilus HB8]2EIH_B Chain B, Alcohol dehydrogenase [Thermus thermophilus HB8]QZY58973.1 zinc-binding dehydrogenase [Thermus thermophilus]BAD70289.1 alcohol dehydrogenase [Thermus thermophilus HB8]BBL81709.1 alcohol dehydrogenase [Thermus thermophilus]BBL84011.1 alcohol dehydrogenase [Thermus thermophilus]BBL92969.1 alcohol dehydrogenase [Thermus thermophilus]
MRAVVMRARGGPEVLEVADLPVPEPGPKEVRVRLKAAALNHLDVWVRKGVASPKLPLPHVLGADGSGVVDAVGPGVEGFAPGDEVVINPGLSCGRCERCLAGEDNLCPRYQILGEHRHGTYAEYVVLPEANLAPKPKNLSFEEAAAIPLTFLTAWQMVVDKLGVRPGDDVLVMAAGSGVSVAAIQIAKLFGARVIATAGSEDKLRRAKALGADETVNYTHPDWPKEVRRLTGGKGADKVVDHTGALYFEGVIKATANGGRIAIAGASSGYEGTLPFAHVFYRQLSILGSTMASKSRLFPILRFVEEGKLKPVVGQVLPLEAAAEGHRLLEERRVFGKVVLQVG